MLTILNAIELSADYLDKKEVESARINSELLLAHILNCNRMELYLKFDQPLKEEEVNEYRELIKRRGNREPLQYIIGNVEFFGLEFFVNKNVLIPRSETELLVETIINKFKNKNSISILDIGTGSGNIAISLSKNLPGANIIGIDKSKKAIDVAKKNSVLIDNDFKLKFEAIDFIDFSNTNTCKFDLIVSNPPYISLKDYESLDAELKNYEPKEALTDFEDGYYFYKIICKNASKHLLPKGKLFFEIGFGQSKTIKQIMDVNGFINISIIKDYQNIDRVIFGEIE
jgi:release factor glutamine methyltransferase